jgi:hypothetical protein
VGRPERHADSVGKEPDARFSFANEQTFLAWIRTARPPDPGPAATRRDLLPVVVGTTGVGLAVFVLAAFYPG